MTWKVEMIPDLTGRTALVTGANSGVGYWTAYYLAQSGAHVVLACRSPARAEAAAAMIRAGVPEAMLEILELDLADLASVRSAAETFAARHGRLEILCNNAGVALIPQARTCDGFEMNFGANFLGHFALTGLLIDLLSAAHSARVIHVGSLAHRFGDIDMVDPNYQRRPYSRWGAYAQSKLASVIFMMELERRFRRKGLRSISVGAHPGMSWTQIGQPKRGGRSSPPSFFQRFMNSFMLNSPCNAAEPSLYAATKVGLEGGSYIGPGATFENRGPPAPARLAPAVKQPEVGESLWLLAEMLTGVRYLA